MSTSSKRNINSMNTIHIVSNNINKINNKNNGNYASNKDSYAHSLIRDMLLGMINLTELSYVLGKDVYDNASKGFFHALYSAIKASKTLGERVLVTIINSKWSGIAIYIDPYLKPNTVEYCAIDLGIPKECNNDSVLKHFPSSGEVIIRMYSIS